MSQSDERKFERAQGGIARVDGDVVTFGNGSQASLNGTPWARAEAGASMVQDALVQPLLGSTAQERAVQAALAAPFRLRPPGWMLK